MIYLKFDALPCFQLLFALFAYIAVTDNSRQTVFCFHDVIDLTEGNHLPCLYFYFDPPSVHNTIFNINSNLYYINIQGGRKNSYFSKEIVDMIGCVDQNVSHLDFVEHNLHICIKHLFSPIDSLHKKYTPF